MSLQAPSIVIFDMDGTTIRHLNPKVLGLMEWLDDTAFSISKVWGKMFDQKKEPKPTAESPAGAPVKPPKAVMMHRALHKMNRKPIDLMVEPCPGIYTVLSFLKRKGIPMGLVSNGLGKGYGLDVIQQFDLKEYFDVTIFREDIHRAKPHPESFIKAVRQMGTHLGENDTVWYVGDRHKDVTAAQSASRHLPCTVIPIAYAVNAAIAILEKKYGPEHIIMSYHEMYKVLNQLFLTAPNDAALASCKVEAK